MTSAPVFLGEQLSLSGFALGAAPFVYTILFESSRPVSNNEFFAFAQAVNELITTDVVEIAPIDQTHFYATVNMPQVIEPGDIVGEAQDVGGITFTVTGLYEGVYRRPEKLSTGAVVGIGAAVAAAGGAVIYLATRKKKRRRRTS